MKKLSVFTTLTLVVLVSLTACGPTPTPSPPPATEAPPPATEAPPTEVPPTEAPPAEPAAGEPVYGGILTIISKNTPVAWGYPPDMTGFGSTIAAQPCLEGFLDHTRDGTQIRPLLATDWELAEDELSITLTLRQGVKFHDGTDFNAEAAKWNLEQYISGGAYQAELWESIDILDDYTVRINLEKFQNTLISNLDSIYMISPTAFEENGKDWAQTNAVGTGPFKQTNFERDVSLEYERFDDYWGGKPYLDGLKYTYIADETTALMAFEAGEGLVLEEPPTKTAYDLQGKGYQVIVRRGPGLHLVPDGAHPDSVYADKRVREAVEYAIDRVAIAEAMGYGFWEPTLQPAAPEQFGYVPDLVGRPYDPEKAKQLLADAGYPDGFNTKIIASPLFAGPPLEAIQSYLSEVGIGAELDVVAPAKWSEYRNTGWDNALIYCPQGATDYNYAAYLERYYTAYSVNYPPTSMLKPQHMLDLIDQALVASDLETQAALCQETVSFFVEEALAVPLWIEAAVYVLHDSVHDTGYAEHGIAFRWDPGKAWLSK